MLFLETAAFHCVGVITQPGLVIFDTTPLQALAGQFDFLLAAVQDVAIYDHVKVAITKVISKPKYYLLGIQPTNGLVEHLGQGFVVARIYR